MGDTEDKTKGKQKSSEENRQSHSDSRAHTSDESGSFNEEVRLSKNMLSIKKPMPATHVALLPNQFMGTQDRSQTLPPGKDIIELMLRFKWTIVVITILVTIPLIAAIWTQIVPKYKARGELRIRPIIPRLVFQTEENGMIPLYNSFVNTQVSIIRSPVVLQRALDQKEVQETQWFKKPSMSIMQKLHGGLNSPLERLRGELSVLPRRHTEMIDVSLVAEKGEDAKVVVDAVLEQYINYIGETSNATEDKLYRQLTNQNDSLKKMIAVQEDDISKLQQSLGTALPRELISSKRIGLEEKRQKLNELQQRIEILEWNIKQDANTSNIYLSTEQLRYSQDTEWRQLDINVKTKQHNINNSIYTDKHPNMIILKKDLKFAEELRQRREAQLDDQWSNQSKNTSGGPILVAGDSDNGQTENPKSLKQQLAWVKHEKEFLLADLDKQQKEFDEFFASAQRLEERSNELVHTRGLYNAVRRRLDQKDIERNVPGSIGVSTWALASSQPYNDRRMVYTAMAIFLGLGVGGGVAFLRASRNQTVYTPKDIPVSEGVPLLGYVPLVNLKKSIGMAICKEISQNEFLLNESLRVVRTVLLSSLNGKRCTTLLISSATTGTGKSTFTMLLGRSLAGTGKKVLVIDADIKKMTLTRQFEDQSDNPGFIKALREPSKYKQNIFRACNTDLDFMPAGRPKKDRTVPEEIANGAFKILINNLKSRYDIILMDGSPILPVADSIILSGQVDGTIFVEREHISNRANIVDAIDRINSSGGNLIGSIFVGSKSHDKYNYDYSYSKMT